MAASSEPNELEISIDLGTAKDNAERAVEMLVGLRRKYDLRRWEYTRQIRIAPLEIPHSHPVLTLNGFHAAPGFENEDKFLQNYLHE